MMLLKSWIIVDHIMDGRDPSPLFPLQLSQTAIIFHTIIGPETKQVAEHLIPHSFVPITAAAIFKFQVTTLTAKWKDEK